MGQIHRRERVGTVDFSADDEDEKISHKIINLIFMFAINRTTFR
jgi:hypothetical protein